MGHLTFAELIARRVPLSASEAAALTLAVARLMDVRRASGQRVTLPDDEWILLSSSGDVSIVEVHGAVESDETAGLSALLRRLLRLDERGPAARHTIVPGGLLIVLARNLGYIHLPATSPAAFRAALERFGSADPAVLSAVFWRAASGGRDARTPRTEAGRRLAGARTPAERRSQGPSRTDLRRALRELEQELFELRTRIVPATARRDHLDMPSRRSAAAAALAVGFVGALAVAGLAVTGGAPARDVSSRPDAVVGPDARVRLLPAVATGAALAGTPDQAAREPRSDTPSVARRSKAPLRAAPADPPRVVRVKASAETRSSPASTDRARTKGGERTKPKRDPLSVHRGGTRGIPFALPR
jgi:hypothetical protein